MADTIAYAVLQVIPSMRGVKGDLDREMTGVLGPIGQRAGREMGAGIASGLSDTKAQVERASDALVAAQDKVAAATGKVRVAEQQLQDLRDSGRAKQGQIVAAEERLAEARRKQVSTSRDVERATARLDQANQAASESTRRLGVDMDLVRRSTGRLGDSLGSMVSAQSKLGTVAVGMAAIGGAAGAAVGGVGALAVGLAALGPAALAGAATAAVGLHGVVDAFKALAAADDAASSGGGAQQKAIAAAEKQLETAVRGVATAEKDLTRAKKDRGDAERDVNRAVKEATDQLESFTLRLADARVSEEEAVSSLIDAQKDLAKASDPDERRKAAIRVERAEVSLAQTRERNAKLQRESEEAQRKGVDGSDEVVKARERLADANDKVADAETRISDARSNVRDAQKNLADAASQTSAAQDKAAQALAKLSPNAQAFVLAMRSLGPEASGLKKAVQDAGFAGLDQQFTNLFRTSLPGVRAGMVDVASAMNTATRNTATFLSTAGAQQAIQATFAGTGAAIRAMQPGLAQAAQGFTSFASAVGPQLGTVGAAAGRLLGSIGQSFSDAAKSGALADITKSFAGILDGLSVGLKPILDGLIQAATIVGPTLGPLFAQLGGTVGRILPDLARLGATLVDSLVNSGALPALEGVVHALGGQFQPLLPVAADLLAALLGAVQPLIEPLGILARSAGYDLAAALKAATPAITELAKILSDLAPHFPVIVAGFVAVKGALFAMDVAHGVATAMRGLTLATTASAAASKSHAIALGIQRVATLATSAASAVWTGVQWALNAALTANPIGLVIAGLVALGAGLVYAYKHSETFRNFVDAAWSGIKTAFAAAWDFIKPILTGFASWFTDTAVPAVSGLWHGVIEPAFNGIGAVIGFWWRNVTKPILDAFKTVLTDVIPGAVNLLWHGAIEPAFNGIKAVIKGAWDTVLSPTFGLIKSGVGLVGNAFSAAATVVKTAWDAVLASIRPVAHAIGNVLAAVPTKILGREIPGAQAAADLGNKLKAFREGGQLRGPGTGTSDSMIIRASNGEFLEPADRVNPRTLPVLEAIRSGWTPSPEFLHAMLPGYVAGGLVVPGKRFAESMDSATYAMGGFSRSSIDCSGMVSAVVNDALGRGPFSSRMSTVNEGAWLAGLGAVQGTGGPGDLRIGWFDHGGGANGHTALTLPDGTHVESRGGDGVVVGGSAAGADDAMFDQHMYIPARQLRGGDLGSPAGASPFGPPGAGTPPGGGLGTGTTGTGTGTTGTGTTGGGTVPGGTGTPVIVTNWPQALLGTIPPPAAPGTPGAPSTTTTPGTSTSSFAPGGGVAPGLPAISTGNPGLDNALNKFGANLGKAGDAFLQGQIGGIPGGQIVQGGINHWNVIVKDVDELARKWAEEQRRRAMAPGSRF